MLSHYVLAALSQCKFHKTSMLSFTFRVHAALKLAPIPSQKSQEMQVVHQTLIFGQDVAKSKDVRRVREP